MEQSNIETQEIPEYNPPVNPFLESNFAYKWWNIYQEVQDKKTIQKLYDLKKITKEEYIKIVGEEPLEQKLELSLQAQHYKETKFTKDITLEQDLMLLEQDIRIMDIESTLPSTFSLKNAYSSRYFNLLNRIIDNKTYGDVGEFKTTLALYLEKGRINQEEYDLLLSKLPTPQKRTRTKK